MSKISICIIFFVLVFITSCQHQVDDPQIEQEEVTFFDDFNTFDSSTWTAIERGASWNNEDQAYSPNNVWVEDGYLIIESREESWVGPPNLPWHPDNDLDSVERNYTSGQVESKGKFSFTYGKIEVRAKMETTPGMLNAIWMVPESGNWPPEIDIAEQLGHKPDTLYTTSHYGTQTDHKMNDSHSNAGVNLSEEFHTYGVEWEEDEIRWYLDGVEVFSATKGVPDEPFYIVLCPAIGPDWTGNPGPDSIFPLRYMVDWVKVVYLK